MNKKINLKLSSYPEAMIQFAEENLNMKFFCGALVGVSFLLIVLVLFLVKQGPTVIALESSGAIAKIESKITNLQIDAAIREYISHRYSWDDKSIFEELGKAKFFVLPQLVSAFDRSMLEVQKFVRDRKVKQRVYPKSVNVDLKEKKVVVSADRITEFDNLKAATEMKLVLHFSVESRSVMNPWGIYITKEIEESAR